MRIKVEQRHIDNGKPKDEEYCPVALALRELTLDNDVLEVHVEDYCINFGEKYYDEEWEDYDFKWKEIHFSKRTAEWIKLFDNGNIVKPFQFNLTIPQEYLR